jgi:phenylpropionate dioxygenase-like ring-hydroxylating dioxygenase large terminal subunit
MMRNPTPGQLPLVPRVPRAWYVLGTTAELRAGAKPLKRRLYGDPIALWRGKDGVPAALLDRCPHRDVPLSFGCVKGDHIQCGYHGWEFDREGACKRIPSLLSEPEKQSRRAISFPVREQQGFVWVWGDPESPPDTDPYTFAYANKPGYLAVRQTLRAQGSLHAIAENALDVPHTAFLHGGLFRNDSADRNRIRCVVERTDEMVQCEFIGEPRPEGIVAKILSPSGGVVTHFDRFRMPCIVEVEYSIGDENHIVNVAALTPVDDHETDLYSVVALRTRIPALLLRPFVQPLALRIFQQDAVVLQLQTDSMRHFGSTKYVSTEVDLLGPHILRLLHRAASGAAASGDDAGEAAQSETYRAELEMEV